MARTTHADKIWKIVVTNVERDWGRIAFARLGSQIQQGLLAKEAMAILVAQDEQISAESVRTLTEALWERIADFGQEA